MQVIYFNIEIVEILLTVYRISLNSRGSGVKYQLAQKKSYLLNFVLEFYTF